MQFKVTQRIGQSLFLTRKSRLKPYTSVSLKLGNGKRKKFCIAYKFILPVYIMQSIIFLIVFFIIINLSYC